MSVSTECKTGKHKFSKKSHFKMPQWSRKASSLTDQINWCHLRILSFVGQCGACDLCTAGVEFIRALGFKALVVNDYITEDYCHDTIQSTSSSLVF